MESESFIQPGGLQGLAMILRLELRVFACRISGMISAWSCEIEKFAKGRSTGPLSPSKEYTVRARSEAPIGLRMKLRPMPQVVSTAQLPL